MAPLAEVGSFVSCRVPTSAAASASSGSTSSTLVRDVMASALHVCGRDQVPAVSVDPGLQHTDLADVLRPDLVDVGRQHGEVRVLAHFQAPEVVLAADR